MKDKDLKTDQ